MKSLRISFSFIIILTMLLSMGGLSDGESWVQAHPHSNIVRTDPSLVTSTQISEMGRYIYDTDFTSAEIISEFLISLNFDIEIISMDEILLLEWVDIGFVVIGADTGFEGSWGSAEQITLLKESNLRFLGFGEGGLSFYENIPGLTVTWQNSMTESIAKIDVNKINTEMWIYPHLFPESFEFYIKDDKTHTLIESKINSSVVVHGKSRNSTNPMLTFEMDRYYFWGIQSVTELWTNESYKMLDNIISYLINGGVPVTPNITGPTEVNYIVGTVGNMIDWVYHYILFSNYSVYIDNVLDFNTQVNIGNRVSYNVDGLSIGQYTFSLILYDISGRVFISEVEVIVSSVDLIPSLTNPPDAEYWFGDNDHTISWVPTDTNPKNYSIYQNESIIENGNWTSGSAIILTLDNLVAANYNFTLQLFDQSNQSKSDSVIILILMDLEVPIISYISNFAFDELMVNKTLTWSATDIHPSHYKIYNDSSVIDEGLWDYAKEMKLNVSTFTLGIYNITFAVSDSFGNVAYESKDLLILDQITPNIKGPSMIYNEPGSTLNDIQWELSDNHPANYTVLVDGNHLFNGTWEFYPFVDVDLSGFSTGIYNFTIIVEDTSRNTAFHIVRVYVDIPKTTTSSAVGGESSPEFIDVKSEYVIGVGFVATIFVAGNLIRRRSS